MEEDKWFSLPNLIAGDGAYIVIFWRALLLSSTNGANSEYFDFTAEPLPDFMMLGWALLDSAAVDGDSSGSNRI